MELAMTFEMKLETASGGGIRDGAGIGNSGTKDGVGKESGNAY
jgi:hypothetical protein